jgi:hypothetical protein
MTHNSETSYAALLGDVIASRHSGDREELQHMLDDAMSRGNAAGQPVQPLRMTIGDEFQGLFGNVAEAISASLQIRMTLRPTVDVRIGIGWGTLDLVPQDPPFGQDGPCWWRAREAIEEVKKSESSNSVPRSVRTLVRTGDSSDELINAYLVSRDHITAGWDEVDVEIARLFRNGVNQTKISEQVGLSQSSVSRRLQNHGILTVLQFEPEGE